MSFRAQLLLLAAAHVAVPTAAAQLVRWRDLRRSWLFVLLSIWSACIPALAVSRISSDFPTLAGGAAALLLVSALAHFRIGLCPASRRPPRPHAEAAATPPPPLPTPKADATAVAAAGGAATGSDACPLGTADCDGADIPSGSGSGGNGSRGGGAGGNGSGRRPLSARSNASTASSSKNHISSVHSGWHSVRAASWSRFSSMSGVSPPARRSFAPSDADTEGPAAVSGDSTSRPNTPQPTLWATPATSPAVPTEDAETVRPYSASHSAAMETIAGTTFASRRARRSGVPQHTPADSSIIMTSFSNSSLSEQPQGIMGTGGSTGEAAAAAAATAASPAQRVFSSLLPAAGVEWRASHTAASGDASTSAPLAIPRTAAAAAMLRVAASWESAESSLAASPLPCVLSAAGGAQSAAAGTGGPGSPLQWPGGMAATLTASSGGRTLLVSEPLLPHKEEEDEELQKLQDAMSELGPDFGSEVGSLSVASRAARAVTEGWQPTCDSPACEGRCGSHGDASGRRALERSRGGAGACPVAGAAARGITPLRWHAGGLWQAAVTAQGGRSGQDGELTGCAAPVGEAAEKRRSRLGASLRMHVCPHACMCVHAWPTQRHTMRTARLPACMPWSLPPHRPC